MLPQPEFFIIVTDTRAASLLPEEAFSGWQWDFLRKKILRAGIRPDSLKIHGLNDLASIPPSATLISMGEGALYELTGKKGIDKWQLSPLKDREGRTVIPTFDMSRVQREYELGLFQEMAFRRAAEFSFHCTSPPDERFLLNPGLEETLAVLDELKTKEEISVDVETGYGQINTVGFAWSESDAIAINVLPERLNDASYYELWRRIGMVLSAPSRKIFQNFVYDVMYFKRYGLDVTNIYWDTMWGMKVLWPELKSNLGNVGRIYTRRPYWKDDGKVTDEEGKKKDWGNVRDWTRHYLYNCRDTTGTFEAFRAQLQDCESRGLTDFAHSYIRRLIAPTLEMCANGIPFCSVRRDKLRLELRDRIAAETKAFHTEAKEEINPRSPKQVQDLLRRRGVVLPRKFDKKKGESRESVDAGAIKKIRMKYPDLKELAHLQEIKTLEKALSSYIDFETHSGESIIRYSLNMCGTETLRASGGTDPWDCGFNVQTIPREGSKVSVKSIMVAPEGWSFFEVDLSQAESRYVAYASACKKLIDMLESGADVHAHVAHAILRGLGLPASEYSKQWRNLGKKTGHGSNYLMKEGTFVENVFKDMDMVLTKAQAKVILAAYFEEFPEIKIWHNWIKQELYQKRKLTAPTGWERYFYGRPGDDMLREGVAWAPQHTIPWIINHLMLYLCEWRKSGGIPAAHLKILVQVHDSLILLVRDESLKDVASVCLNHQLWHPQIVLPGGRLIVPTEAKAGKAMDQMEEVS